MWCNVDASTTVCDDFHGRHCNQIVLISLRISRIHRLLLLICIAKSRNNHSHLNSITVNMHNCTQSHQYKLPWRKCARTIPPRHLSRVTTLFQQWFSLTFPWPKKWISMTYRHSILFQNKRHDFMNAYQNKTRSVGQCPTRWSPWRI